MQLADGIFYTSAVENAASAMEVMAVAGRNVALLVKRHLDSINDAVAPAAAKRSRSHEAVRPRDAVARSEL